MSRTTTSTEHTPKRPEKQRIPRPWHVYRTTLVSTTVVICSTLGVYVLGVLAPFFTRDLGIETSELGILTSAIFITAAIVSLPSGWLSDRTRVANLTAIQMLLSGISVALLALVGSLFEIILICVVMGFITAMHGPLANRTVAGYVDNIQYKFVIGWRSLGPQMGSLLVGVAVAPFLEIASWRIVMAALGIAIALTAIPLFTAVRSGDRYVKQLADQSVAAGKTPPGAEPVTRTPSIVYWLMAFTFFSSGGVVSIAAYLPSFAVEDFDLSIAQAGLAAGVTAFASIIARGIWIKLLTETNEKLLMGIGVSSAAAALVFLAVSPMFGAVAFWVAAILAGATALGTSPLGQIVLMRHCPPAYIGRASARTGMMMYATSIIQPLLFGIVAGVWGIATGWLVIAAGSALGAILVIIWSFSTRRSS